MADEQTVLTALAGVHDPELHRDIVSLNMVRDVTVEGGIRANRSRGAVRERKRWSHLAPATLFPYRVVGRGTTRRVTTRRCACGARIRLRP